jgi:hypothetical protein
MRGERGQATVEWIGVVLLVAVALAVLGHLAPKADGRDLGTSVVHSVTRPVLRPAPRGAPPQHPSDRAFQIPPLIPRMGQPAELRIRLPRARTLMRRARAGAGQAWRRAWIACLVYERFRYALLHPESRFHGHTIPPSEVLRMVNDCISPLDLVRDWPLMRGQ